jgi:hypothetical protein
MTEQGKDWPDAEGVWSKDGYQFQAVRITDTGGEMYVRQFGYVISYDRKHNPHLLGGWQRCEPVSPQPEPINIIEKMRSFMGLDEPAQPSPDDRAECERLRKVIAGTRSTLDDFATEWIAEADLYLVNREAARIQRWCAQQVLLVRNALVPPTPPAEPEAGGNIFCCGKCGNELPMSGMCDYCKPKPPAPAAPVERPPMLLAKYREWLVNAVPHLATYMAEDHHAINDLEIAFGCTEAEATELLEAAFVKFPGLHVQRTTH